MSLKRRSLIRSAAAFAALGPFAAASARAVADEAATAIAPQEMSAFASLVRQAARAHPPTDPRTRAAVEGTVARLEGLAFDHTQGRFILANIPAAEVVAYQNGVEVLRSRAIVGAGRTRTPRLTSVVPSVRLNPPWYVPASIAPTVNTASGLFRRVNGTLVQAPGPRNPLGPIRIGLEDSQGVFLHGTSEPRLFARAGRALSHGCVRVERIVDLAAWVLDMAPDQLRAMVATGRTRELVPAGEVRVALAYLTVWPGEDGRLVLHPDPYGLDRLPNRGVTRPPPPRPIPVAPPFDQSATDPEPA